MKRRTSDPMPFKLAVFMLAIGILLEAYLLLACNIGIKIYREKSAE